MIDKLHYISQQTENESQLTSISNALQAGCKWIQLRVKDQTEEVVLDYATEAKKLCDKAGARLIVNDFPYIALKVGAYGVHLGLNDMSIIDARKIVGNQLIIGGTANTLQHVIQRIADGVDYIGLGPYRFTRTKKNLSPILGWDGINNILKEVSSYKVPIIAIGGILPEDIGALMDTGIHGVALSGTIANAPNRGKLVQEIYKALNEFPINLSYKA